MKQEAELRKLRETQANAQTSALQEAEQLITDVRQKQAVQKPAEPEPVASPKPEEEMKVAAAPTKRVTRAAKV